MICRVEAPHVMLRPPHIMLRAVAASRKAPPVMLRAVAASRKASPVMLRAVAASREAPPCHAARSRSIQKGIPRHAARSRSIQRGTPLSCCAQSQHPERPVERFTSEVPGFRDYARNDSVEAATPRGAHPPRGAYYPVMLACTTVSCCAHPLSCCAQSQHPERHPPVMLRVVAASRKARRTIYVRGSWIPRRRAQ